MLAALITNIWNGTRLACFRKVRRDEFVVNGTQAVLLLMLAILLEVALGGWIAYCDGEFVLSSPIYYASWMAISIAAIYLLTWIQRAPALFGCAFVVMFAVWPALNVVWAILIPLLNVVEEAAEANNWKLKSVAGLAALLVSGLVIGWYFAVPYRVIRCVFDPRTLRALLLTLFYVIAEFSLGWVFLIFDL